MPAKRLCVHCTVLSSVPYKRKNVQKFFRHFRSEFLRIPAFLFPAKSRRQLRYPAPRSCMLHEACRKLAELRRRTFFSLRSTQNQSKRCLCQRDNLFCFVLEITLKPDKKMRKFFSTDRGRLMSCGIFTLGLARTHYFRHFCRK